MEKIDITNYPSIAGKFGKIEVLVKQLISGKITVKNIANLIMVIAEIVEQCILAPGSGEQKKTTVLDILSYLNSKFGILNKTDNWVFRWIFKIFGAKLLSILIDYTVEILNKKIWKQ